MKRSPEFDVSWSFDFTWDKMDKNTSKLQPSSQLLVVSARFYPPAESPGYQRMSVKKSKFPVSQYIMWKNEHLFWTNKLRGRL